MTRNSREARPSAVNSYERLIVWRESMLLVDDVYRVSASFPSSELFGITSQMRRAAVSVACNIAEGHAREGRQDYIRMLGVAWGSLAELETLIRVAHNLRYVDDKDFRHLMRLCQVVGRMLVALQRALRRTAAS